MIARRAWVSGRVQDVSFRALTRMQAERLGLRGHALNLPDGRGEGLVCGEAQTIEALLRWPHTGSPAARVEAVHVEPADPADCPTAFAHCDYHRSG
ncbi:acylphosphatase [Thiomonas intermedia]|uniref:acylphosphatase n=1 Tax=Thiomonas intermedia TaxID=926 RepID=UPI0009A53295|nr:acylphosphatase [Thiomonas intermedia]